MTAQPDVYTQDWSAADRGLFASNDIPAGSLIFKIARPLLAVLDRTQLDDTCSSCFRQKAREGWGAVLPEAPEALKVCSGCKKIKFCNKDCQLRAWKRFHKHECSAVAGLDSSMLHSPRAVLQLFLRRAAGAISDDDWSQLLRLKTHADEVQRWPEAKRNYFETTSVAACKYSDGKISVEEAIDMAYRMAVNCLTLVSPTFDSIGTVLDPLAATANHSCDPNAVIVMDGPEMAFRTLKSIKKDEQIFISYIDATQPCALRSAELEARFHFRCRCSRCLSEDHDELTPKQVSDAALSRDLPPELIEKADHTWKKPSNLASQTTPNLPKTTVQKMRLGGLLKHYRETYAALPKTVPKLVELLKEIYGDQICTTHQHTYASARQDLFLALLDQGHFAEAFKHGIKRHLDIDPVGYPVRFHPVRVVRTFTLAILALVLLPETEESSLGRELANRGSLGLDANLLYYRFLTEVLDAVDKSHGWDNSFARMVRAKTKEAHVADDGMGGQGAWQEMVRAMEMQSAPLRRIANSAEY